MKQKGFTIVELLIFISIILIITSLIMNSFVNNRGATEKRAMAGAQKFITENKIKTKRVTCAGDSNGDGYGTCNIVTADDEKLILSCPTGFVDVEFFGASACKEELQNVNFMLQ